MGRENLYRVVSGRDNSPLSQRSTAAQSGIGQRIDEIGTKASLICAIHCAIMPLVITLLPLMGLSFLADARIEWVFVATSAVFGVTGLRYGYREHGSLRAFAVLGIALVILVFGRIAEQYSLFAQPMNVLIVVLGGIGVATAHIFNRSLCQSCQKCQTDLPQQP